MAPLSRSGSSVLVAALLAGLAIAPAAALAEPPTNDAREQPHILPAPTGKLDSTLEDATLEGAPDALPGETPQLEACNRMVVGDVWARFTMLNGGRVVLRLKGANKSLDAVMAVSRITKTGPLFVTCDRTDILGQAGASITPPKDGATYEVRLAQLADSESSARAFRLSLAPAPPEPRWPGVPLSARGARGTVDRLADTADAYRTVMLQGVTYRVNLAHPSRRCVALRVFSPFASWQSDPSYGMPCGGYSLVTPGAGFGGRWTFRVEARDDERFPPDYRLTVAPVRPDDMGPGVALPDRRPTHGRLEGGRIDVIDIYRVDIAARSYVTFRMGTSDRNGFDLRLISRRGRTVSCACRERGSAELRKGLHRGRFFVVVRARGRAHGTYTLTRIDRALTGLGLRANGQRRLRVPPSTTVRLGLAVRPAVDGPADIRIERFDPLTGWHFHRMVRVQVRDGRGSFPFLPPAEGTWRADAHFRGTNKASPSDSRRVQVIVQAPIRA